MRNEVYTDCYWYINTVAVYLWHDWVFDQPQVAQ